MPAVFFEHKNIGNLRIDTGIDEANWAYGLNTVSFPTYGGEVVQILSVYIDNLSLVGTISTYKQAEAIYEYFTHYFQISSQGTSGTPNATDTVSGTAYNLIPMYFSYPERNWFFKIYPQAAPGFRYGRDVVTPTWQLQAFVVDDSPDLDLIKDGLKALAVKNVPGTDLASQFKLTGQISPQQGNPDTDPFQTYSADATAQQTLINRYADYYNSLIPAYAKGDFSALTAAIGSKPALGNNTGQASPSTVNVPTPAPGTTGAATNTSTTTPNPVRSGAAAHGGTSP